MWHNYILTTQWENICQNEQLTDYWVRKFKEKWRELRELVWKVKNWTASVIFSEDQKTRKAGEIIIEELWDKFGYSGCIANTTLKTLSNKPRMQYFELILLQYIMEYYLDNSHILVIISPYNNTYRIAKMLWFRWEEKTNLQDIEWHDFET